MHSARSLAPKVSGSSENGLELTTVTAIIYLGWAPGERGWVRSKAYKLVDPHYSQHT